MTPKTNQVIVVFTRYGADALLREGGTGRWRLNPDQARQCRFVVCTRKTHSRWAQGHGSAFLVGKVKDVVPSELPGRYFIEFSEYAQVATARVWRLGDRNPVRYAKTLEDLGIKPSKLKWQSVPDVSEVSPTEAGSVSTSTASIVPLTIPQAKQGLALTFNVPPDAIEITIRG